MQANNDNDIDELKELVRNAIAISEDTNRIVHRMRRSALWGRFFQVVWWVAIIAVSGAAYLIYLQPYVARLEQLYTQVEGAGQQGQTWGADVQQFLSRFVPQQTPAQQ